MENRLFHFYTSGTGAPRLASTSMELGGLRLLCNDWTCYRHRHDGSDAVNEFGCHRFRGGQHRQRAVLCLLGPVWLAIILDRGPRTEASKIPSSQSPVPFLI